ncbi:flavin reductase family protein [Kitasatospora sp. MAP5-34]|uniref:flavin reductase family protein n=1 Tax=Kitasatospora sp. MAP5-34 TaxID=3035102 RepID=UPI00247552DA|nr:flavin reductase family protein [Kitasatospora sp. MAP5-34]MDH6577478.1 flavin reductase (DIM6/NTAB) family NADH-FMN oxidoreductase RutF [Kitasatospora sp. MAP5-34]
MSQDLRTVMRHFATGVCVVSTFSDRSGTRQHDAVTVNSLTSVSLDPALISLCFRLDSRFLKDLRESRVWGVSILCGESEAEARAFARDAESRRVALDETPHSLGEQTGVVLLEAAGWMECTFRDELVIGDHVMVIGEVVRLGSRDSRGPLIFLQGGFHTLELETA